MNTETQQVTVPVADIRKMLEFDPEFFIHFFLADQLSHEVPDFHIEIFTEMTHGEVKRLVIAIPRAHAKTTLAKLCAVWYLLFSDYRFVLYVSGSHDLVVPYVNDIASFFDTENFQAVFGRVEWRKRQDGVGIYEFKIPSLNKVCILRGLGSGQRVRGINVSNERPQLAIVDDAEDDEDVESDAMHQKMMKWWFGPFIKCLNPFKNKVIVAGNLLSARSLLYKLLTSDKWRSYLYGSIRKDGKSLWPDMWPIEALKDDFREYESNGMAARWFAEMMNQPVAEGGGIIKSEEICYKPARLPPDVEYGFITVDPAISKESWADRAAVVAHAWIAEEEQWQIVETDSWRGIDPTTLFYAIIAMAARWGFRVIGVETAAMQGGIKHHFEHLKLLDNLTQYEFVELSTGNQRKNERITTWASQLKKSNNHRTRYALTEGDYIVTQQLLMLEPLRKDNDDDVIDCCAYGTQMQTRYMAAIMRTLPNAPVQAAQRLVNMAEC